MRRFATAVIVVSVVGLSVAAHGQSGRSGGWGQGIPPGHLPPPGECRVWYDGRPPGRQPAPTSCREAERIAARSRTAHVIYGRNRSGSRAIPRPGPYPGRDRFPTGGGRYGYGSVAFDTGYRDGHDKGQEDARDRDSYDPVRHGRYRSGDHGYDRRYGTKEEYKYVYREGFEAGYAEGYRSVRSSDRTGDRNRLPWPF